MAATMSPPSSPRSPQMDVATAATSAATAAATMRVVASDATGALGRQLRAIIDSIALAPSTRPSRVDEGLRVLRDTLYARARAIATSTQLQHDILCALNDLFDVDVERGCRAFVVVFDVAWHDQHEKRSRCLDLLLRQALQTTSTSDDHRRLADCVCDVFDDNTRATTTTEALSDSIDFLISAVCTATAATAAAGGVHNNNDNSDHGDDAPMSAQPHSPLLLPMTPLATTTAAAAAAPSIASPFALVAPASSSASSLSPLQHQLQLQQQQQQQRVCSVRTRAAACAMLARIVATTAPIIRRTPPLLERLTSAFDAVALLQHTITCEEASERVAYASLLASMLQHGCYELSAALVAQLAETLDTYMQTLTRESQLVGLLYVIDALVTSSAALLNAGWALQSVCDFLTQRDWRDFGVDTRAAAAATTGRVCHLLRLLVSQSQSSYGDAHALLTRRFAVYLVDDSEHVVACALATLCTMLQQQQQQQSSAAAAAQQQMLQQQQMQLQLQQTASPSLSGSFASQACVVAAGGAGNAAAAPSSHTGNAALQQQQQQHNSGGSLSSSRSSGGGGGGGIAPASELDVCEAAAYVPALRSCMARHVGCLPAVYEALTCLRATHGDAVVEPIYAFAAERVAASLATASTPRQRTAAHVDSGNDGDDGDGDEAAALATLDMLLRFSVRDRNDDSSIATGGGGGAAMLCSTYGLATDALAQLRVDVSSSSSATATARTHALSLIATLQRTAQLHDVLQLLTHPDADVREAAVSTTVALCTTLLLSQQEQQQEHDMPPRSSVEPALPPSPLPSVGVSGHSSSSGAHHLLRHDAQPRLHSGSDACVRDVADDVRVHDALARLLDVAVADRDARVRLRVLQLLATTSRLFDAHVCQPDLLDALFMTWHDVASDVREAALRLLCRLPLPLVHPQLLRWQETLLVELDMAAAAAANDDDNNIGSHHVAMVDGGATTTTSSSTVAAAVTTTVSSSASHHYSDASNNNNNDSSSSSHQQQPQHHSSDGASHFATTSTAAWLSRTTTASRATDSAVMLAACAACGALVLEPRTVEEVLLRNMYYSSNSSSSSSSNNNANGNHGSGGGGANGVCGNGGGGGGAAAAVSPSRVCVSKALCVAQLRLIQAMLEHSDLQQHCQPAWLVQPLLRIVVDGDSSLCRRAALDALRAVLTLTTALAVHEAALTYPVYRAIARILRSEATEDERVTIAAMRVVGVLGAVDPARVRAVLRAIESDEIEEEEEVVTPALTLFRPRLRTSPSLTTRYPSVVLYYLIKALQMTADPRLQVEALATVRVMLQSVRAKQRMELLAQLLPQLQAWLQEPGRYYLYEGVLGVMTDMAVLLRQLGEEVRLTRGAQLMQSAQLFCHVPQATQKPLNALVVQLLDVLARCLPPSDMLRHHRWAIAYLHERLAQSVNDLDLVQRVVRSLTSFLPVMHDSDVQQLLPHVLQRIEPAASAAAAATTPRHDSSSSHHHHQRSNSSAAVAVAEDMRRCSASATAAVVQKAQQDVNEACFAFVHRVIVVAREAAVLTMCCAQIMDTLLWLLEQRSVSDVEVRAAVQTGALLVQRVGKQAGRFLAPLHALALARRCASDAMAELRHAAQTLPRATIDYHGGTTTTACAPLGDVGDRMATVAMTTTTSNNNNSSNYHTDRDVVAMASPLSPRAGECVFRLSSHLPRLLPSDVVAELVAALHASPTDIDVMDVAAIDTPAVAPTATTTATTTSTTTTAAAAAAGGPAPAATLVVTLRFAAGPSRAAYVESFVRHVRDAASPLRRALGIVRVDTRDGTLITAAAAGTGGGGCASSSSHSSSSDVTASPTTATSTSTDVPCVLNSAALLAAMAHIPSAKSRKREQSWIAWLHNTAVRLLRTSPYAALRDAAAAADHNHDLALDLFAFAASATVAHLGVDERRTFMDTLSGAVERAPNDIKQALFVFAEFMEAERVEPREVVVKVHKQATFVIVRGSVEQKFGISYDQDVVRGVVVTKLAPNGLGARAGVPVGAQLLAINGRAVHSVGDIRGMIEGLTRIELTVAFVVETRQRHEPRPLMRLDALAQVAFQSQMHAKAIYFNEVYFHQLCRNSANNGGSDARKQRHAPTGAVDEAATTTVGHAAAAAGGGGGGTTATAARATDATLRRALTAAERVIEFYSHLNLSMEASGVVALLRKSFDTLIAPGGKFGFDEIGTLEQLHWWAEALARYEARIVHAETGQLDVASLVGALRCHDALGNLDRMHDMIERCWGALDDEARLRVVRYRAKVAFTMGAWQAFDDMAATPSNVARFGVLEHCAAYFRRGCYDALLQFVQARREALLEPFAESFNESYSRSYDILVELQHLTHFEELVSFAQSTPERQAMLQQLWHTRLTQLALRPANLRAVVAINSLVLPPRADLQTQVVAVRALTKVRWYAMAEQMLQTLLGGSAVTVEELCTQEPELIHAYMKFVCARRGGGDAYELLAPILQCVHVTPHDPRAEAWGWCWLLLGELTISVHPERGDEAIAQLHYATTLSPRNSAAFHSLGILHYDLSRMFTTPPPERATHSVAAVVAFFRAVLLSGDHVSGSMHDVVRILSIWFGHSQLAEVNAAVRDGVALLPAHVWLSVVPQLIARIGITARQARTILTELLVRVGLRYPQALIYPLTVAEKSPDQVRGLMARQVLAGMRRSNSQVVEEASLISNEMVRIAILWAEKWHASIHEAAQRHDNAAMIIKILTPLYDELERASTPNECAFDKAFGHMLRRARTALHERALDVAWSLLKRVYAPLDKMLGERRLHLADVSPTLAAVRDSIVAVPGTFEHNKPVVTIDAFRPVVYVMPSKQKPRRFGVDASDGRKYHFLLKGHEDMRQDERVMQFIGLVNRNLASEAGTSALALSIPQYAVIPLSENVGIIGWVENSETIYKLLETHRHEHGTSIYEEVNLVLRHGGLRSIEDYHRLPKQQRKELLQYVMHNTPDDELARIMWGRNDTCEQWLVYRSNYGHTLAAMSMIGYVLGLGDRHLNNLMLEGSGMVVHIDFGDCFEVAMLRALYAEAVPFRLTRLLVKALGITGVDGVFRLTSELVMRNMRKHSENLLSLLEAFIYDPLLNWRLTANENERSQSQRAGDGNANTTAGSDNNNNNNSGDATTGAGGKNVASACDNVLADVLPPAVDPAMQLSCTYAKQYAPSTATAQSQAMQQQQQQQHMSAHTDDDVCEMRNQQGDVALARVKSKLAGQDFDPVNASFATLQSSRREYMWGSANVNATASNNASNIVFGDSPKDSIDPTLLTTYFTRLNNADESGRDVKQQVDRLIQEAMSLDNLADAYLTGWAPFW